MTDCWAGSAASQNLLPDARHAPVEFQSRPQRCWTKMAQRHLVTSCRTSMYLLDQLCHAGIIRGDAAELATEFEVRGGETTAQHAQRIVQHLTGRLGMAAEQVAELLLRAQIESADDLRVLSSKIRVLLVEDNPADIELTRRALLRRRRFEIIGIAEDATEAIAFLTREPPFENARRPDMILLDIDLPGRDGFEVLRQLKSHPHLESTPVIVLSGSTREDAAEVAFREHAVSFISKPNSLADYRRIANHIEVYWSQVSALP